MSGSPVWHPFTQHGLREPIPHVVRSEGAALFTADGARVIDAVSSWWVTTHGHNHPPIVAAVREAVGRLDQMIFAGWTHPEAERLAADLVALVRQELGSDHLTHVFFSDSGSTSVEVALKMALGTWRGRGEPRHRILVMDNGYHGDTIGAMSVGARGVFNRAYAPLLFDVSSLPFPTAGREQATLDALEAACRAEAPAALIVEPLALGAGGMLFYAPDVLADMADICRRHGVLFIADEVMTGWGRTGTMFACSQAGVVPDLLCLSKGLTGGLLPLAVTLASEAVFAAHCSTERQDMFFHSSSYTANAIACAAANANLAVWRDEPVLGRIDDLVARQDAALAGLAGHPAIGGQRRLGTIAAMELGKAGGGYAATLAPELMAFCRERDVLLRPLGSTVYVMPPYCIGEDDLTRVYAVIGDAADRIAESEPLTA